MSDCCSGGGTNQQQGVCPAHGGNCREVAYRTVLHHIKQPWAAPVPDQRYYFCDEPGCPVVYFTEDGTRFDKEAIREPVGQKGRGAEDMLCYCFDIRYGEAAVDASLKAYVVEQTSAGLCSCETRNPSGHCCLGDFPR